LLSPEQDLNERHHLSRRDGYSDRIVVVQSRLEHWLQHTWAQRINIGSTAYSRGVIGFAADDIGGLLEASITFTVTVLVVASLMFGVTSRGWKIHAVLVGLF
jgi:hypothetical protein